MPEKKKFFQSSSIGTEKNESKGAEKAEEIEKIYKETPVFLRPPKEKGMALVVVLAVVFGLFSGLVGAIIFRTYLGNLPFFGSLNISSQVPGQDVVIKEPRKVVVEQDLRISQVIESTEPALVSIYNQKPEAKNPLEKIYLPDELLGQGIILTSDGWLMTSKDVIGDFKKKYLVLTSAGKEFTAFDFILDPATNFVFFKVEAKDLPVVKFGDRNNLSLGQAALALNGSSEVAVTTIESLDYSKVSGPADFILSSEKFSKYILLKDSLDRDYLGAPLVNLGGEIIGVMTKNESVGLRIALPANYAQEAVASILKDKKIKRPYLGIHYLDLSKTFGLDESLTAGKTKGALIFGNDEMPALDAAGPAQKNGLKKDDIILRVEDEEINGQKSLTEIIQRYKPGDIIDLALLRNKEEKTLKVELGEVK